ncbi:serine hydrolase domain-containing protein [Portibacter marinus]|uniref:serine hydrolase domain-containing protein n=1 Tax=Portibacter marinus TaxID=2898660 RepID=UPI001F33613C|nr:serine hydrolase domain-containing protein [Portibacter marinus]
MRYILAFFYLILFANNAKAQVVEERIISAIDSIVKEYLSAREYLTGGVICIVSKDSTYLQKGYGLADLESQVKFSADSTELEIASVSKLITTTALLSLVELGKLELDKPVEFYIGENLIRNKYGEDLLVRHLLTHTSGIDDRSGYMESKSIEAIPELAEYIEKYFPQVIWTPGRFFNYSNYAFVLTAFLIEEVSGQDFSQYIKENLLVPLKMEYSGFSENINTLPEMRRYRLRENDQNEIYSQVADESYSNLMGAAGFKTTGADMVNFLKLYLNNGKFNGINLLSQETIANAFSTHFTYHPGLTYQQGLGWRIKMIDNQKILYHYGDDTGIESSIIIFPESRLGIFMCFNNPMGYDVKVEIENEIFHILNEESTPSSPNKISLKIPNDVAGDYLYMNDSHTTFERLGFLLGNRKISVRVEADSMLYLNERIFIPAQDPLILKEKNKDTELIFLRNDQEKIGYFSFGRSTYRKIKAWEDPNIHRHLFLTYFILAIIFMLFSLTRFLLLKLRREKN